MEEARYREKGRLVCYVCYVEDVYIRCPLCSRSFCVRCFRFLSSKAEHLPPRYNDDAECFKKGHLNMFGDIEDAKHPWELYIMQTKQQLENVELPFATKKLVDVDIIPNGNRTDLHIDLLYRLNSSSCSLVQSHVSSAVVDSAPSPPRVVNINGTTYHTFTDKITYPNGRFSTVYALMKDEKDEVRYVLKMYKKSFKARFALEVQNYTRLSLPALQLMLGEHVPKLLGSNEERQYIVLSYAGLTIMEVASTKFALPDKLNLKTQPDLSHFYVCLVMQAAWISYVFGAHGISQNDGHGKNVMVRFAPPGQTWQLAYRVPGKLSIEASCPLLLVVIDYNVATTVSTASTRSMSRTADSSVSLAIPGLQGFTRDMFGMCRSLVKAAAKKTVLKATTPIVSNKEFVDEWTKSVGSDEDLKRFYGYFANKVGTAHYGSTNIQALHFLKKDSKRKRTR